MNIKKIAVYSAVLLFVLSTVITGLNNAKTEKAVVTISGTNALAGKTLTKSTAANPASDFKYIVIGGSSIGITGYVGSSSQVVVPDTIDGKPVKRFANSAFSDTSDIAYIYIPASVELITNRAFSRCDGLLEIEVSADNAWFSSLDGVLYNKDKTVLLAFPGAVGGEFTVPKTVTKIGGYAFFYCYELTKINMYNNVTQIGDSAFSYCWNLKSIRLSDNLTSLGKEALAYNLMLTSVYLPKNITSIGENALLGAQSSPGYYEYNFVDGIYCVEGSYAYDYVASLHISDILFAAPDLRYDMDCGVYISSVFELGTRVYANAVTEGSSYDAAAGLLNGDSFYGFTVYELGANTALGEDAVIYIPAGKYPNLLRTYKIDGTELISLDSEIVSLAADGNKYVKFTCDSLGTFAAAEYFNITKGDADGDGVVTIKDARLVLRAAVGLDTLHPAQVSAADLDSSGKLTVPEARKILRVAVKLDSFD